MSMFEEFEDGSQQDIELIVEQFESARKQNRQVLLDQESFDQLIDYYLDKNELDRALDVSNSALVQFPYSGSMLLRKAELLFDAKQLNAALDTLGMAEVFDPSEIGIYLLKSEILTFQSQYKEAISILENVIDAADAEEKTDIYLHMADVYEDWQRYDDVFNCLTNCLDIDPQNEEALNRINYCVEITQQFEKSAAFHSKLIDEHPYCYLAWYNLACAYNGLELIEKAIEALEYVLAINEDASFAHFDIADLYYRLGRYDDALKEIKEHHSKAEPDEELYFLEGRCHEAQNNFKMARYLYRKAIHIFPGFHEAYYRMAESYCADESWMQAYNAYDKAAEMDGNVLEYWVGMAEAALALKDLEKAVNACHKAIEVRFNHYSGYFLFAKAMLLYGDYESSLEVLEKGIAVTKDDIPLRFARIGLWMLMGQRKRAETELLLYAEAVKEGLNYLVTFAPDLEEDTLFRDMA